MATSIFADWLPEKETARQFKKSTRTLKRWRDLGIGPPYRQVGRDIHYHVPGTRQWLETGMISPVRRHRRQQR
jgi:hypothetical protein